MKNCVVIFPLYKKPSSIEQAFLDQGLKLTQGFKQVIVAPIGLKIDKSFGLLEQLEVKRFSPHYFTSIMGYNQLLLSTDFYKTFHLFDFMLIHQSDAYLFKDDLQNWCNKNYDYIGAPWLKPKYLNNNPVFKLAIKIKLLFKKNKLYANRHNKVGNGGLSLRKIKTALHVLELANPSLLEKYHHSKNEMYNEDIFWSFEAPKIMHEYRVPDYLEALNFAIEFNPEIAFKYLKNQLPFGCHAPLKHAPQFWMKFIPSIKNLC